MSSSFCNNSNSSGVSNKSLERKVRKPKIEKLRRARINTSLEQLKEILLRNTISIPQGTRPMKLDKADILAMTVRYVEMLHEKLSPTTPIVGNSDSVNLKKQQQRGMEKTDMMVTTGSQAFHDVTNLFKNEKSLQHQHAQIINDNKSSSLAVPTSSSSSTSSSLWFYNRFNLHQRNLNRMCVGKENFIKHELNENLMPSSMSTEQSVFSSDHHWRPW